MKKRLLLILTFLTLSFFIFAQGANEIERTDYLASTAWTAAFAQLGGLDGVTNIAPANLVHPPEYEVLPSDIVKIKNSKLFIYAGYEAMMKTLSKSLIEENRMMKINTNNSLENVKTVAAQISKKVGTQELSMERVQKYEDLIVTARAKVKELGLDKLTCSVQFHLKPMAEDLGLNVVNVYGPAAIDAKDIQDASVNKYQLIIDNIHMPQASAFKEVSPDSKIIQWRNFPDNTEDDALYNLMKNNIDKLIN